MYEYTMYFSHEVDQTEGITAIFKRSFDSFSVQSGTGVWGGSVECSVTVQFIGIEKEGVKLVSTAKKIRDLFGQDCVIVTRREVDVILSGKNHD